MLENKEIRRIVFRYAPETCPAVDLHFDDLTDTLIAMYGDGEAEAITEAVDNTREKVKADGTIVLREAMIDMAHDYESRLEK